VDQLPPSPTRESENIEAVAERQAEPGVEESVLFGSFTLPSPPARQPVVPWNLPPFRSTPSWSPFQVNTTPFWITSPSIPPSASPIPIAQPPFCPAESPLGNVSDIFSGFIASGTQPASAYAPATSFTPEGTPPAHTFAAVFSPTLGGLPLATSTPPGVFSDIGEEESIGSFHPEDEDLSDQDVLQFALSEADSYGDAHAQSGSAWLSDGDSDDAASDGSAHAARDDSSNCSVGSSADYDADESLVDIFSAGIERIYGVFRRR